MKIETSTVTKLLISELDALDPVTVFLEDFEPGKGKITISCYGKSWTSYWGAMSGDDVATFVCRTSPDYLIGCLAPQLNSTRFSGEELSKKVRQTILKDRRQRDLVANDARELFDEANDLDQAPSLDYLHGAHSDLMYRVFGDEWWYSADRCSVPNPDYTYLERIVHSVKQALKARSLEVKAPEVAHG